MFVRMLTLVVLVGSAARAQEGLSKDEIGKVIRSHQDEVKFCFEHELKKNPELSGKVAVAFWIEKDGSVREVSLEEDSVPESRVSACVVQRIKRWKFPRPMGEGRVRVTFPWIFKTAQQEAEPEAPPQPEPPLEPPPDRPSDFELERQGHTRSVGELWAQGGAGMYPVLLGLLFGLATGFLALVMALAGSPRAALVIAGLCLGGGGFSFSTGWLGYVNGMMGAYEAVANVNPADKDLILRYAELEASVCWQFGTICALACLAIGGVGILLSLRRKAVPID